MELGHPDYAKGKVECNSPSCHPGRVYRTVMCKIGTADGRLPIPASVDRRKRLRYLRKPGKVSRLDSDPMLCGV